MKAFCLSILLVSVAAEASQSQEERNLQLQGTGQTTAAQLLAGAIRGQSLPIGVSEVLLPPLTGASAASGIQRSTFPVANGVKLF